MFIRLKIFGFHLAPNLCGFLLLLLFSSRHFIHIIVQSYDIKSSLSTTYKQKNRQRTQECAQKIYYVIIKKSISLYKPVSFSFMGAFFCDYLLFPTIILSLKGCSKKAVYYSSYKTQKSYYKRRKNYNYIISIGQEVDT